MNDVYMINLVKIKLRMSSYGSTVLIQLIIIAFLFEVLLDP